MFRAEAAYDSGDFMLDLIWVLMIVLSIICSIVTGRADELSRAVGAGAEKAIQLIISMAGVMCFWSGIMKIAEKSGLTDIIAKLLSPVLGRLMPVYKNNAGVMRAVSANVTANILGLGNAATPLGIIAMKEMRKTDPHSEVPDDSMIMFVLLNTASLQIIPATAAALRQAAGSSAPYDILPFVWMASGAALCVGIASAKLMSFICGKKRALRG